MELSLGEFLAVYGVSFALMAFRYLFFAGGAFFVFWVLFGKRLDRKRIQKSRPGTSSMLREFGWWFLGSGLDISVFFSKICVFLSDHRHDSITRTY